MPQMVVLVVVLTTHEPLELLLLVKETMAELEHQDLVLM
jgi:hypothetical protein